MAAMTKANDSGRTASVWMQAAVPAFDEALPAQAEADVCVIGAGIAGLTTAYLLGKAGRRVIVLDDGPIGGGETGRTTAHLSNALDDRYYHLEALHGAKGARLAAESHGAAIDAIERIAAEERIECELLRLDGYLLLGPKDEEALLDRELAAAHRAGLTAVEKLPQAPLPGAAAGDRGPCLRFPRQGQLHPLRYLAGLAQAIVRDGGRIYTHAHAESFEGGDKAAQVTVRGGRVVSAGALVVATNSPVNNRYVIHTKQAPYRSYVIGVIVPKGAVPAALFWDTADPYHYVRLAHPSSIAPDADMLIVGGEDHKTGQEDDAEARWGRLEAWTRELFPQAGAVVYRWSGQVMEPIDGLGFIGRNPHDAPNVYIATGDSGHGMTHGTIAGLLITDLISGRESPWATLYDPGRISLRAAKEFAKESLNVAAQYADWLRGSDVPSVDDIQPGQGAIMRRGVKMVAVYRDPAGVCHERSAACPHLGGVVSWNSTEKSWDCPVHGSRFDPHGRALNGPAISGLAPVDDDEDGDEGQPARVADAAAP
jgi:glycine/D-amino acid oxidase-like deaminating enzyme/nitrite reductase/ring-hydroxylating ferredoxin subunit